MSNTAALFACSRCFTRHPFEELSPGQQLCKECRGAFPVVKCTYCRSEFQQTNKLSTSTICKKCEVSVKSYGKPTACEYCNIIAAFIGSKCQRCANSERKYGPPVTCEQCKQKCAFDRKDEDKKTTTCMNIGSGNSAFNVANEDVTTENGEKKDENGADSSITVDGKLLCWLCTLSFKRALAKTKQSDAERRAHSKMMAKKEAKNKEVKLRGHNKRPNRVDVTKMNSSGGNSDNNQDSGGGTNANSQPTPAKMPRMKPPGDPLDPNSSDHVVAMTQLKEQMASMQKQLQVKDSTILSKDKQITELKAKHFTTENELRSKMNNSSKEHDKKVEMLQGKIKTLQKEVATLSKSNKKERLLAKDSGAGSGSGTDSPSVPT